jgi:hypothetical protein
MRRRSSRVFDDRLPDTRTGMLAFLPPFLKSRLADSTGEHHEDPYRRFGLGHHHSRGRQ